MRAFGRIGDRHQLADVGIDWQAVALQLEAEGIRKFVQPHEATLSTLRERIAALAADDRA